MEQQTIALDDSLAFAHMALGQIYLYKKQYDQATAEAERSAAPPDLIYTPIAPTSAGWPIFLNDDAPYLEGAKD